jgi:molybdate transport system substrate-binding protein
MDGMKPWRVTLIFLVGCLAAAGGRAEQARLLVSAAASLREVLQACAAEYGAAEVTFNFGGSGALAAQIKNGAPVDVFFAAGEKAMAAVVEAGLAEAADVRRFLGNRLVLIAPKGSMVPQDWAGLRDETVQHVAIGEPGSVPAGAYAAEALGKLGLLDVLKGRLVYAKDVRQVLAYVERGEAEAGVVYATDAAGSDKVRVVAVAPGETHAPITYPLAVVATGANREAAQAFAAWLEGPAARGIFERSGFLVTAEGAE